MINNNSKPEDLMVQLVFTNFIASAKLSNVDVKSIKKHANELRTLDPIGVNLSNRLGWQSEPVNLNYPHSSLIPLLDSITIRAKSLYEDLKFSDEYELYVSTLWININGKYNYNKSHDHPMSLFAGVFYVNCPGPEDCGRILFENPNPTLKYYLNAHVPKGKLMKERNHLTSEEWFTIPNEGLLLLFPGWLKHHVEPNLNDEERISIGFNVDIRKK